MSGRSFALFIFAALAIALLVLFGVPDGASADTIKVNLGASLDCGGADDNEVAVADNSCPAGTGKNLNATADSELVFEIPVGHSNAAKADIALASPAFRIAMDSEIPNGAAVGQLTTVATLSLLNGPCTFGVPVSIPLFDATTDVAKTIVWAGDGSNLITQDNDSNGLADGVDQYPSFLNSIFNSVRPRARYYGYTNVAAGAPPTQLNFVIFGPDEVKGTAASPGLPKPDQELNDSVGYVAAVVLGNPDPTIPATPSPFTDFCTPLNVTTRLWGKTQGEGRSIAAVGAPEMSAQCSGVNLGKDNDGDGNTKEGGGSCNDLVDNDGDGKIDCADFDCQPYCDDGCIVVNDKCDDAIDNDGDMKLNEYCVSATGLYAARVRSTNPSIPANPAAITSSVYGTGSHLIGAYVQSYRDADADGIANIEDSCPFIADGREWGASCVAFNVLDEDGDTFFNDGCPRNGTPERFPAPNECAAGNVLDEDGDTFVNDGCPPVQKDLDNDGLGDVCDPVPAVAINDQDADGFLNRQDNCPLVANANQLDSDSYRCNDAVDSDAPDEAPARRNDGCPAVGAQRECDTNGDGDCLDGWGPTGEDARCTNAVNDDPLDDAMTNDGCPLKGGISEFCVVSNGDFGPCSDNIGDACDAFPLMVDGDYDKDFPRVAVCVGSADDDLDGWCYETEILLGSAFSNAGNPGNQNPASPENFAVDDTCIDGVDNDGDGPADAADAGCSVPEYKGLVYTIDPAPQVCDNMRWYASAGDPIGDGAPVDDDGDTFVNAADVNCGILGDSDVTVNDGCPMLGGVGDGVCNDNINNDANTEVNDGCPALGAAEAGAFCDNNINDDINTEVNDGCPQVLAAPEAGVFCADALDNDGDTQVNDGCPMLGTWPDCDQNGDGDCTDAPLEPTLCANALNDDSNTEINDGCPQLGATAEADLQFQCANNANDDASSEVNDGCWQVGAAAEAGADCANDFSDDDDSDQDGVLDRTDNCRSVYNPEQLNTDTLAFGGGDALGDACDLNDDGDGLTDDKEWARGSDAKNSFSPFFLDLNGDDTITAGDAIALRAWIATPTSWVPQPTQVCLP